MSNLICPDAVPSPKVSFIVPLYNHVAETQAMLETLRETIPAGLSCEIILIDDFSLDGTREWLATLDDSPIKKLFNSSNLGYARSNNVAARAATGEILALLNNDLLLAPGWLEPMLAVLENPALKAGLVGNVQFSVREDRLDHAGVCVTPQGKLEHIHSLPSPKPDHIRAFAITGACCLITRADFEHAGGFDEAYVNGGEDVDLCLKLRQQGKYIYVATGSSIRHHVSLSRDHQDPQNEWNSRRIYAKWRREIKNELARQWASLLQDESSEKYDGFLDGKVMRRCLMTPHAIARVIAESILQREECYWLRLLDRADPNADLPRRCRVRGIRFSKNVNGYLLEGDAEFSVTGVRSLRNFFVYGRKLGDMASTTTITLSVNEIQEKTFVLGPEPDFRVGIIDPIVLQGVENCFKLSVRLGRHENQGVTEAAEGSIVISRFVVDDQVVDSFPARV